MLIPHWYNRGHAGPRGEKDSQNATLDDLVNSCNGQTLINLKHEAAIESLTALSITQARIIKAHEQAINMASIAIAELQGKVG
jgi:hypothetical protein